MKLVSVDNLEVGMCVGRTIYGENEQVLLSAGTQLSLNLIKRIRELEFSNIYIIDEFSNDIEVNDIISEDLRREMTTKIKKFFNTSGNLNDSKKIQSFAKETNKLINSVIDQIINSKDVVVNLVDLKTYDGYTFQHSVNVGVLAAVMGVAMNYNRKDLVNLTTAAVFHDIGKMMVNTDILLKPTQLTSEEFEEMKKHSQYGYDFVMTHMDFSATTMTGILMHHERYNGLGYPFGKRADEIPDFAKIIAVCDVFDAITSNRVYHKATLPSEAIEYIMANKDEHFSSKVVEVFIKKVAAYPIGTVVELSSGQIGVVCENKEGFQLRPKVKIRKKKNEPQEYIDLSEPDFSSITIIDIK